MKVHTLYSWQPRPQSTLQPLQPYKGPAPLLSTLDLLSRLLVRPPVDVLASRASVVMVL